ncbi:YcxB family protein [Bacteroidales bacterium OttesenSCG-928-M11]|nr:YcxB family protein [Bacteroidales bacterium OttesenSCG-928-M11]
MKIAYKLTAQDFVSFQEYYMKKKAPISGCLQPSIIIMLLLNIVIGIALYFIHGITTYTYVCLFCVLLLGILLIGKGFAKKRLLKSAIQMEKEKPGAFGNMTMDFSNKGIDVHSSTQEKFLKWEEIDKFDSNKHYYFIYSKKGMVYIIPKRDVSIDENEFTTMLGNHLNK